ncbi:MAG: hypothetical protein CMJ58_11965 [Planctomycetaceae bacterium]|nr:hypothetical protein [Planctomycetaceae bacterium]
MPATTAEASSSEQLLSRLNDPAVAAGLNRLLDKLDLASFALDSMDGFLRRGEVIADSVGESLNELKQSHPRFADELLQDAPRRFATGAKLADAAGEMDIDELSRSHVLARLTDPATLSAVNRLLDQLPLLAFLAEAVEELIGRSETIAENVAGAVDELHLRDKGGGLDKLLLFIGALPRVTEAGEKLLASGLMDRNFGKVVDAGVTMVESGMLDEQVVGILGDLGKKFAETFREVSSKPIEPVGGLFATLRATKDPDVQKSVGFAFALAKAFAKHLK